MHFNLPKQRLGAPQPWASAKVLFTLNEIHIVRFILATLTRCVCNAARNASTKSGP
jgi:hypothetical protein